jgi:hypothetical protein
VPHGSALREARGREFNFNKAGAGRWYVGYGLPTRFPVPDTSRVCAVVFWKWLDGWEYNHLFNYWSYFGYTNFSPTPMWPVGENNKGDVPRYTHGCVVVLPTIQFIGENDYYTVHQNVWAVDYPRILKHPIGHELGHAVGMVHTNLGIDPGLMNIALGFDSLGCWQFADSVYTPDSWQQFSIKRHPR